MEKEKTVDTQNVFRLLDKVTDILEKRATDAERNLDQRMSYNSALIMVLYALQENEECLRQFDY